MSNTPKNLWKEKRAEHNKFYKAISEYRSDLFRFCRKLTNNPWDAEDLVQETLLKAYGRLSDKHFGVTNMKSYLFKMASNQWIDWCRRSKLSQKIKQETNKPIYMGPVYEVKDALSSLHYYLPPKERICIVLKDIFEFSLEEVANVINSTEGAVKSALSRGRKKMEKINNNTSDSPDLKLNNSQNLLMNKAVEMFNKSDLEGFSQLFVQNAIGNAPGCFYETNLDEIKKGSLFHTINDEAGASWLAEHIIINGEDLFVIKDGEKIDDIWRFDIEENKITMFNCYYCCPKVLEEIAEILNTKANYHGYYYEEMHN